MTVYAYKAFNNTGHIQTGSLEASSKEEALSLLGNKQLSPLNLHENLKVIAATELHRIKVKTKSVLAFTRQLLSLIKAGIPLTESLELMIDLNSEASMRVILKELYEKVRAGESFSNSLQQFPNIFSELYVNSIRIAETAGNLEKILQNLVTQLENVMDVRKDIRKALSYPAFLVSTIILAFIVFTTYIFPKFLPFFQKSTTELPYPTKIVIFIASLFTSYGLFIGLAFFGAGIMYYSYSKSLRGKYKTHYYLLRLPMIGNIIKKISNQRFCNTISILIGQGIPLVQAMEVAIKTESNYVLREKIISVRHKVENGQNIASALRSISIYPKVMIHMIAVGEVTGELEQMLKKVSEFFQLEISNSIETITSLIEPLITILLALVVLFLALSIFLPMWNMMGIVD